MERAGERMPSNDGSHFEPMNCGDLASKTFEHSPSPIGWERAGVRVHGERKPHILDARWGHELPEFRVHAVRVGRASSPHRANAEL